MNEKKLAGRLANGDVKALEEIIEEYTGYVCTVAYNFSRGMLVKEDIDEISADVFSRLWKCRSSINTDIGLRSYLSAAARNAVRNRFSQLPRHYEDISELELPSDFLVEDAAELHEMISCLYEGLRQLPQDEQELFFRFYFYGERVSQIAAETGINKAAADTRLHRIRKKLKEYLMERGYDHV